jgi:hypothetical protein
MDSFAVKLAMSEYVVVQKGEEFVVFSSGLPLLKFQSEAAAEAAIAGVSLFARRPILRRPEHHAA